MILQSTYSADKEPGKSHLVWERTVDTNAKMTQM